MEIRPYDRERDLGAVVQVHRDAGWADDSDRGRQVVELHFAQGSTLVGLIDGRAECFASNHDGEMQYLDGEIPMVVVGGVATSYVARQGGHASRLTAEAMARDVIEKRAAVAVLGVFDHGFYDRLGFGPGAYDHVVAFDPAALRVPPPSRPPIRLGLDDVARIHANRAARPLRHGGLRLRSPGQTQADMMWGDSAFGLGYEGDDGRLTHHVWIRSGARGAAPWWVQWMAYEHPAQILELLALLKGHADQVRSIKLIEPPEVRIWDLLDRPWRRQKLTQGSPYEASVRASSWWAARICDVETCIAAVKLPTSESVAFNLVLADPVAQFLSDDTKSRWPGVAGSYVIRLGSASSATRGSDGALPTMRATVGPFTRLWLGVQDARGLALTSPDLDAPDSLLADIDRILRLPTPELGWDI